MECGLQFHRYRRRFRATPRNGADPWRFREGILIRLNAPDGRCAYGEIAPLPAFGTEVLPHAESYLLAFAGRIRREEVEATPEALPCCRFALESAWDDLESRSRFGGGAPAESRALLPVAGLLPGGKDPGVHVDQLLEQGYRTLKWKVGVTSFEVERDWFRAMRERVPKEVVWRLDANGALDVDTVEQWARELEEVAVEFLEQPLPVREVDLLLALAKDLALPLALDESVGTVRLLREWRDRGWPGFFVVKPAISGSPFALERFLMQAGPRVVFSSALETGIGLRHALEIVFSCNEAGRAVGWGTGALFGEDKLSPRFGARLSHSTIASIDPQAIWNQAADEPWGAID